jgi:hypothetical protein
VRSLYLDATEDMRVGTVATVMEQIHLKHFPIRTMRIQIYEAAPRKILKDLPVLSKLRTLTLDSIHMTSNSMKQILRIAPNLKNLILDYETITRARYPVLSSVTNLHVCTEYDEETSARLISNCFPSLKVLSLSTFSFWRTKMTISSATLQFLCVRTAGFQLQLDTPAVRSIWIYGGCSAVPAVTLVKPAPELGIVEIFREFTTFEAGTLYGPLFPSLAVHNLTHIAISEEDEEFMLQNGEMKRLGSWIASGKAPNLQCVVWMGPAEFLFCPTSHFPICLRVSDYPSDREVVYGFCRTNNWMELRALRSRLQRAASMR